MPAFKILVLICSMGLDHADCQPGTAIDVVQGPEAANEAMCGFQAQTQLAAALGIAPGPGEYPKIICIRSKTAG